MRISDWSSDVCSSDLIVERPSGQIEPRRTKLGLEAEAKGYPLRCGPGHHHDNGEDNGNLPPEYSASTHTGSNRQARRSRSDRKSVVEGKRVSVRVELGGRRIIKKTKTTIRWESKSKEKKT